MTKLIPINILIISNVLFAANLFNSRFIASSHLVLCIGSFTADKYNVGIRTGFLIVWIGVRIPDYIAAREVSELGSDTWALARMSLAAHHLYIDSYSIDLI